jgi:hypothetical protein
MADLSETPSPPYRVRSMAHLLLVAVMLLLAFRMTCSEGVRETLAQRAAAMDKAHDAVEQTGVMETPFVGPNYVATECVVMLLVAAGAAGVAATRAVGGLTRGRTMEFVIVAAISACAVASVLHAANRFNAMAGLMDITMAIVAGWTVAVLCAMLGDGGRRVVLAGLAGILMLWVAKGYLQKFVEFPDMAAFAREHRDEILRAQGIEHDEVQAKLFESRMNAGEVTGYLALSNVLATGFIGLLVALTAALVAWARSPKTPAERRQRGEISIPVLCAVLAAIVWAAGCVLLPMTLSRGGTALGYIAVAATACCGWMWEWVTARRKTLILTLVAALTLLAAAVVGYGVMRDRLPSKSLMFRWHYWTASAPIIEQSPMWGVGLNNYGDYYTRFKRPSSPEDVKDPHNVFVRLAAEMGMPAMALVGLLAAWMLGRAMWRGMSPEKIDERGREKWAAVIVASVLSALLWAALNVGLTEAHAAFNWYVAMISAVLAAGTVVVTWAVTGSIQPMERRPGMRYIMFAAALGALAMLIYDQINMALVTGGVAMLFWVTLGWGDSQETGRRYRGTAAAIALCCLVGAGAVAIAQAQVMPAWDPAPLENAYLTAISKGDDAAAKDALEAAIERSPNSIELHMQHIALLRDRLHQPVAGEIRQVLTMDRANARIRLSLAMPNTDLPTMERANILEQALALDAQLPADELKRLSPESLAQVRQAISVLRSAATQ